MTLSPSERREVLNGIIERAAERLLEEVRAECSLDELVLLPIQSAAPMLGISPRLIPEYLPTVAVSRQRLAVSVGAIRRHLAANTRPPAKSSPTPPRQTEAGAVPPAPASP